VLGPPSCSRRPGRAGPQPHQVHREEAGVDVEPHSSRGVLVANMPRTAISRPAPHPGASWGQRSEAIDTETTPGDVGHPTPACSGEGRHRQPQLVLCEPVKPELSVSRRTWNDPGASEHRMVWHARCRPSDTRDRTLDLLSRPGRPPRKSGPTAPVLRATRPARPGPKSQAIHRSTRPRTQDQPFRSPTTLARQTRSGDL
jgi:hypothetical protein